MDNFAQFGTGMQPQPQPYFARAQQQQRPHYQQMPPAMVMAQPQQPQQSQQQQQQQLQPQQQQLQPQQALISPDRVQSPMMLAAGGLPMATGTVESGQFENGLYAPMMATAAAAVPGTAAMGPAPGQMAIVGPAAMQQHQFMMGNVPGPSIAMMQPQSSASRLYYASDNQNRLHPARYLVFQNDHEEQMYVCATLEPNELSQNVYRQVSYYMSRSNLANDYYMIMHMDDDWFVEIAFLANFKRLRSYTNDVTLITNILLQYPDEFDIAPDRTKIRPMYLLFTEIWLRDCPPLTTEGLIQELFDSFECPKFDRLKLEGNSTWIVGYLEKSDAVKANECMLEKKLYILDTEIRATLKFNSLISRDQARDLFYTRQQAAAERHRRRAMLAANNEAMAADQQPGPAAGPNIGAGGASGANNSSGSSSGRESCSPRAHDEDRAAQAPSPSLALVNAPENQMMMQQMPVAAVQQPQPLLAPPVPQQPQLIYANHQLMQHQAPMQPPPPPPPHQYSHNFSQRRMHNNHQQKHQNAAFAAAAASGHASQQVPFLINYVPPTHVANATQQTTYVNWQQQVVSNAVVAAANAQPMDFAGIIALNGLQPQIAYMANPAAAESAVPSAALTTATATTSNMVPITAASVPVSAATAVPTTAIDDQQLHFQQSLIDNSASSATGAMVNPSGIGRISYNSGLVHGGYNNREHGNRNGRNFNSSTNHRRRRNQDDYNAHHQHYNANSVAPTGHFVQRQNQMGMATGATGAPAINSTPTSDEIDQSSSSNQAAIAPLSSASSSSSISNATGNHHQPQPQQQPSTSSTGTHHANFHHPHHTHHQQQHGYNKSFSGNGNGNFFHGQQRTNGNYFDSAGNGRLASSSSRPHHQKNYGNQMYRNYNNNNNSHYNHNSMKSNDWQMRKSMATANLVMQGAGPMTSGAPMTGMTAGVGGQMAAGAPSMASSMYATGNSAPPANAVDPATEPFGSSASTAPSAATAAVERFDIEQARFPPLRSTLPSSSTQQQQSSTVAGAAATTAGSDNAASVTAANAFSATNVAAAANAAATVSATTTATVSATAMEMTMAMMTATTTTSTTTSSVGKNRHVSTKPTAVTNKQTTESFQNTTVDSLPALTASMSAATVSHSASSLPTSTVNISTSESETMFTSSAHSAGTVDATTSASSKRSTAAEAATATLSSDTVFVAKDKATLTDCDNDDEDEEEERNVKVVKTDRKTRNLRNGITSGAGSSANTLERRNKQKRAIKINNGARGTAVEGQAVEYEMGGLEGQMESLKLATAPAYSDSKFNEDENCENGGNTAAPLVMNPTHQHKQPTNNSLMAVKKTKPTAAMATATPAVATTSRASRRTTVTMAMAMARNDEACEHVTTDDIPVVSVNETIGEDTSDSSVGGGATVLSRQTLSEVVSFPLPPSSLSAAVSSSAALHPVVRMSYAQAAQNANQTGVPSVPSKRATTASTSSNSSSCSTQSKCDHKRPTTKEITTTDETEKNAATVAVAPAAAATASASTCAVSQIPSTAAATASDAVAASVVATSTTAAVPAPPQQPTSANFKNKHKQRNGGHQQQRLSKSKMAASQAQANDARPISPNAASSSVSNTAAMTHARKPNPGNGSLSAAAVSSSHSNPNRLSNDASPPSPSSAALFSSSVLPSANSTAPVIENNTVKPKRQSSVHKPLPQPQPRSTQSTLITNATNPPAAYGSSLHSTL